MVQINVEYRGPKIEVEATALVDRRRVGPRTFPTNAVKIVIVLHRCYMHLILFTWFRRYQSNS